MVALDADLDTEMCHCFLEEALDLISKTEQCFLNLEAASGDPSIVENIFRLFHNLKGSSGAVGFVWLSHFAHNLESLLLKVKEREVDITQDLISLLLSCNDYLCVCVTTLRKDLHASYEDLELLKRVEGWASGTETQPPLSFGSVEQSVSETDDVFQEAPVSKSVFPKSSSLKSSSLKSPMQRTVSFGGDDSIRVPLGRIDKLMNNIGELVIFQTGLSQTRHLLGSSGQLAIVNQMEKIIREVQELTMSLRMIPLAQTFQKLKRIARDASLALFKEVDFEISGEEIELDKSTLEGIVDPLVHIVRNALDHGIETPEERTANGKFAKGHVSIAAFHSGGRVVIEIRDDGKGLDAEKLKAKAIEKGILTDKDILTDEQAYHLIFAPGFSTKEQVTDISGRGVGMDVVKTNLAALQGEVDIQTTLGKGTTFRISLPLTLAIIDGMIVRVGQERYVVPLVQVYETVEITKVDVSTVAEIGQVLRLRNEDIPIYYLGKLLAQKGGESGGQLVGIVVRGSSNTRQTYCIAVDQVVGQQQVVIKQVGDEARWLLGMMGAAILGDGEAVLILDVHELLREKIGLKTLVPQNLHALKGVAA